MPQRRMCETCLGSGSALAGARTRRKLCPACGGHGWEHLDDDGEALGREHVTIREIATESPLTGGGAGHAPLGADGALGAPALPPTP